MKILEEAVLYEDKNFYPAFPSVIRLGENRYLISFRLAPRINKGYSHLHSLSKAMVATVYKNRIVNIVEIGEEDAAAKQDAQLFRADDKTILAYYFRYTFHPLNEKKLFKDYTFMEYDGSLALLSGMGICISEDDGKTFSKPHIVKIKGIKSFAIRGNMVEADGEILAPAYACKNNNRYRCHIISSKNFTDWKIKSLLCETEIKSRGKRIEYVEPSLALHKNKLVAFIRTHIDDEYGFTSVSLSKDDSYKTFSKPAAINVNGYPANPLILRDGKLLLTYGYRLKPYGARAKIFEDAEDFFGKIGSCNYREINFEEKEIIIEDKMKGPDCGYPWCAEDGNDIVCVYYGYNDKSKIRKIYMKRFTLN